MCATCIVPIILHSNKSKINNSEKAHEQSNKRIYINIYAICKCKFIRKMNNFSEK